MTKEILTEISDRNDFINNVLKNNNGIVIIKFGAEWCRPCQLSKPLIHSLFQTTPDHVTCYDLDVDDNFDLYAYLKSKKMISGIPVIIAYKKDNLHFSPDHVYTGVDEASIKAFFAEVLK